MERLGCDDRVWKLEAGAQHRDTVPAPQPRTRIPRTALGRPPRRTGESGQAVVEFALVLPFLLALVLVLVDFGKAMSYWINATQVANEGARIAAVNAPGISNLQTYIQGELDPELRNGSINVGPKQPAAVSICFPDSGKSTVGEPVRVKVVSSYRPTLLSFMGSSFAFSNIPISGSATMRLEHDATTYSQTGTCP
jgi:hypothetical protein